MTAGFAKTIQINGGGMKAAELRATFVKIHSAIRIRTLFFYPSTVSPEEENRQLEKPYYQVASWRS